MAKSYAHGRDNLQLSITHQWSAGEVVHIKWIRLQFEVNAVGVLRAANEGKHVSDRGHRHRSRRCVVSARSSPPANKCLNESCIALSGSQMQQGHSSGVLVVDELGG